MKILHVIPNLGVGGTEKILLELCTKLDPKKFKHSVVSLKSGGPTGHHLGSIGIPVFILNSHDGFWSGLFDMPRLHFDLRRTIKEASPDILHTWLTRANVMGRLAASGNVPVIISSLRVMEREKAYHLWSERLTHHASKVVTVNCTPLKAFAQSEMGIPEEKIRLIWNGIEVSGGTPVFKSRNKNEDLVVGTMGRLHSQKGIDIFLRAAQAVLKKIPNSRFVVAGEGPEGTHCRGLARDLGIESRVTFSGLVRRPSDFFSQVDVFVLASRWEGMPNVVMEAMAYGKPIVSSVVGGVRDLIEDGKEGLLVPVEDAAACAKAVQTLIENPSLRESVSRSAYQKVTQSFSMDKMISAYSDLYESVL